MNKDKKTKVDKTALTTAMTKMNIFRGIEEIKKVSRSTLRLDNKDIIYTFIDMEGVNFKLKE